MKVSKNYLLPGVAFVTITDRYRNVGIIFSYHNTTIILSCIVFFVYYVCDYEYLQ